MLNRLKDFFNIHQNDIVLATGVVLISLFSFAMGYITAKHQMREPIQIEYRDTNILMHANDTNIGIISIHSYISIDTA